MHGLITIEPNYQTINWKDNNTIIILSNYFDFSADQAII